MDHKREDRIPPPISKGHGSEDNKNDMVRECRSDMEELEIDKEDVHDRRKWRNISIITSNIIETRIIYIYNPKFVKIFINFQF